MTQKSNFSSKEVTLGRLQFQTSSPMYYNQTLTVSSGCVLLIIQIH